jgi:urea transport system substrate-binding protein
MNPSSDPKLYAEQARKLILEHKVAAIFGCWTSASRKEVLPIVERDNCLLFYPSQYEGQESSPNIFYTGATPHQQALPAINFLRGAGYRRFFLVGSDHTYSRTTNQVIKGYLASPGIDDGLIAEQYVGLHSPIGACWSATFDDSPSGGMLLSSLPSREMPICSSSASWRINA